jgi:hypothetical protein
MCKSVGGCVGLIKHVSGLWNLLAPPFRYICQSSPSFIKSLSGGPSHLGNSYAYCAMQNGK